MPKTHHDKISSNIVELKKNWNICQRKERIDWKRGTAVIAARSHGVEIN